MYLHILEWNGAYTHHPLDPRNKNLSFELLKFKLHMYFYIFRCVIWKVLIHINLKKILPITCPPVLGNGNLSNTISRYLLVSTVDNFPLTA